MRKNNATNGQKRYKKNKARLKDKPQLSKQQRREHRIKELMFLNYLSQTAKPIHESVSTDENK